MGRAKGHNLGQGVRIRLLIIDQFGPFGKVVQTEGLRSQSDAAAAAVAVKGIDIDMYGQCLPLAKEKEVKG